MPVPVLVRRGDFEESRRKRSLLLDTNRGHVPACGFLNQFASGRFSHVFSRVWG